MRFSVKAASQMLGRTGKKMSLNLSIIRWVAGTAQKFINNM